MQELVSWFRCRFPRALWKDWPLVTLCRAQSCGWCASRRAHWGSPRNAEPCTRTHKYARKVCIHISGAHTPNVCTVCQFSLHMPILSLSSCATPLSIYTTLGVGTFVFALAFSCELCVLFGARFFTCGVSKTIHNERRHCFCWVLRVQLYTLKSIYAHILRSNHRWQWFWESVRSYDCVEQMWVENRELGVQLLACNCVLLI